MSDPYGASNATATNAVPLNAVPLNAVPTSPVPPTSPPDEADTSRPSLGSLLSDITTDLSTLMRQEVQLAKAELAQSAKNAGKGAGMLSGAAVAGYFVLLFLSVALWWALGAWFDNLGWAAVVVAILWGVVAAVLASRGRSDLKAIQGAPRTADSVKKIPNALKGHEEENR